MQMTKSKWFLPAFAVSLGLVFLVAMWIGGDPRTGVYSLAIMAAFGAVILLGGRSETIRGLRGDGSDERFRQIDLAATAIAGLALITVVIVAFVVEVGLMPSRATATRPDTAASTPSLPSRAFRPYLVSPRTKRQAAGSSPSVHRTTTYERIR